MTKKWRVRWHRFAAAGYRLHWFWGDHSNPNGSYGWKWFRRDRHVRPANWTASFGPLRVSIWGRRASRGRGRRSNATEEA